MFAFVTYVKCTDNTNEEEFTHIPMVFLVVMSVALRSRVFRVHAKLLAIKWNLESRRCNIPHTLTQNGFNILEHKLLQLALSPYALSLCTTRLVILEGGEIRDAWT